MVLVGSYDSSYDCGDNNEDTNWHTKLDPFAYGFLCVLGGYVTGRRGVVGITRAIRCVTIEGVIAGHDAEGTVRRDSMIIMERNENERQAVGERRKTSRVQKFTPAWRVMGQFFRAHGNGNDRRPRGLWLPFWAWRQIDYVPFTTNTVLCFSTELLNLPQKYRSGTHSGAHAH
jgi:hypothetical protein